MASSFRALGGCDLPLRRPEGGRGPRYHAGLITLAEVLSQLRRLQPELSRRHVVRIGVFGSVARGEARPDSDIDVLVEMDPEGDLFDLVGVKLLLERELSRRIDVVAAGGLKSDSRDRILREVRYAA